MDHPILMQWQVGKCSSTCGACPNVTSVLLVMGGVRHDAAEGVIQHGRTYLSTYFVRFVGVNGGSFEMQYGRGAYCVARLRYQRQSNERKLSRVVQQCLVACC